MKRYGNILKVSAPLRASGNLMYPAPRWNWPRRRWAAHPSAKTLSFLVDGGCALVVAAGDAKVDNPRFKAQFHTKAKMLTPGEVEAMVGHAVGGVCPFAVNPGVKIYLDASLRRFETVFPACGSSNSAIELTISELEQYSRFDAWVDVCKGWRAEGEG